MIVLFSCDRKNREKLLKISYNFADFDHKLLLFVIQHNLIGRTTNSIVSSINTKYVFIMFHL